MATAWGTRYLVPDEMVEGYGADPLLPDGYLVRPGLPLQGHAGRHPGYPSPGVVVLRVGFSEFPLQRRRIIIEQSTYDAVISGIGRAQGGPYLDGEFLFRWRLAGSTDAWKEVPGPFLGVTLSTADSLVTEGARIVGQVIIEDRRLSPFAPEYDPSVADLPETDDIVEFVLLGSFAADDRHPIIVEGITAGQFVQNVYDGQYSPRDPVTGDAIPTGILYDADALARMTDLVRIRLVEPINDARDWMEKSIFAPTGWCPALDNQGLISPVSQVPPTDTSGLDVLDDAMCTPSADWDGGTRVINIVRFVYPRDYSIGPPDRPPPDPQPVRQNLIQARDIVLEYRDELSITRNGEKVLELDGGAFRAIGRDADLVEEPTLPPASIPTRPRDYERRRRQVGLAPPLTDTPVIRSGIHVLPVTGDIADEQGYQLAQLRAQYLLARYAYGAPTIRLQVMRSGVPTLRVGAWVLLDLSWLPDSVTGRRGLVALAQVIGIGDLDCAWRRVLVEVMPEAAES